MSNNCLYNHKIHEKLKDYKFYLCSGSIRRYDILKQLGFNPIIKKSNFIENLEKSSFNDISSYVEATAYGKINDVYNNLVHDDNDDNLLLLSADTVVSNDNVIYEKPKSLNDNIETLKTLRNSSKPILITTVVILLHKLKHENLGHTIKIFSETTEIFMDKEITDSFIEDYCKSGEGLQVAGGFKIQGFGSTLFKSINGDFYNGVGLPANKTFKEICQILNVDI